MDRLGLERDVRSSISVLISASGAYMALVVLQPFVAVEQSVAAERLVVVEQSVAAAPMPQTLLLRHHRLPCSGVLMLYADLLAHRSFRLF